MSDEAHILNCRRHTKQRAFERYGLALSLQDILAAEKQIWNGRAPFVADDVAMRQRYMVRIKGKVVPVVFDIALDCIVTVLPMRYQWSSRMAS